MSVRSPRTGLKPCSYDEKPPAIQDDSCDFTKNPGPSSGSSIRRLSRIGGRKLYTGDIHHPRGEVVIKKQPKDSPFGSLITLTSALPAELFMTALQKGQKVM